MIRWTPEWWPKIHDPEAPVIFLWGHKKGSIFIHRLHLYLLQQQRGKQTYAVNDASKSGEKGGLPFL